MNGAVVVNPDNTIYYGTPESQNESVVTVVPENNNETSTTTDIKKPYSVMFCISIDILKASVLFPYLFSFHLLCLLFSCLICFGGIRSGNIKKISQYGTFHLFENVLLIGIYDIFQKRLAIQPVYIGLFIFNTYCFIVVQMYILYLKRMTHSIV